MAHSLALWGLVETSRYLLQRQREHASRLNKELENKLSGYETSYRFLTEGALNNKRKSGSWNSKLLTLRQSHAEDSRALPDGSSCSETVSRLTALTIERSRADLCRSLSGNASRKSPMFPKMTCCTVLIAQRLHKKGCAEDCTRRLVQPNLHKFY
jgi:hypothetical protein